LFLKNLTMKIYYVIITIVLVFLSCGEKNDIGSCENTELIKFRGLSFQFPITGKDVIKKGTGIVRNMSGVIRTDFPGSQGTINWYFMNRTDTINHVDTTILAESKIYAATIFLEGESKKTDLEIIEELQKEFPGEFVYIEDRYFPYYVYNTDCLSIIVRRDLMATSKFTSIRIPTVSFCYGFTDKQVKNYAKSLGHIGSRLIN